MEKKEIVSINSINSLMNLFKNVNPSYARLFSNKTERACLSRLVALMGEEKLEEIICTLEQTNKMKYAPVITTPYELEKKLGSLMAFIQRETSKTKLVIKI